MFTGLVQAVGQLQRCSGGVELLIPAGSGLDPAGLQLGDSVAVDGVSLTVAGCSADGSEFWIAVIPHTWASTTLQRLRVGDAVNLEADLLAKYTERLLAGATGRPNAPSPEITGAWLAEHGWG